MYQRKNNNRDRYDDIYDYDYDRRSERYDGYYDDGGYPERGEFRERREFDDRRRPANRRADERYVNISSGRRMPKKQRKSPARIIVNLLSVCIIIASLVTIAAYALKDQRLFSGKEETGKYPEVVGSADKNDEYYLVCGLDESKELTDVIMMVCWDKKKNKASIMQIPRDTYISYDMSYTAKINSAYGNPRDGESSEKALCRVINNYFGLPVDHYVYISLSAFRDIVDALGGVEVDVPCDMDYRGVYVKKGTQLLDGKHAEVFMRNRKTYATGDTGRVEAQRRFYAGLAEKLVNVNAVQMISIFGSIKNELITDMTVGEIKRAITDVKKLDMKKVNIFAVPGEGYNDRIPSTGEANSIYVAHEKKLVDEMNKYMNPYGEKIELDKILINKDREERGLPNSEYDWIGEGDSLGQFKKSTAEVTTEATTAAEEYN